MEHKCHRHSRTDASVEHRDAVVLGAGPAGCLAARVLTAAGRRVLLVHRDGAEGGRAHAHRIPAEAWRGIEQLLPGFGERLIRAGASRGAIGHASAPDGDGEPVPWLSRGLLDRSFRRHAWSLGIDPRRVPASGVRVAPTKRGVWSITFPAIGESEHSVTVETPCLVDATGPARSTLSAVASASGGPVPVVQTPGEGGYRSVRLSGVTHPPHLGAWAAMNGDGARAILQRVEPDGTDGASHLLTHYLPGDSAWKAEPEASWNAGEDEHLASFLAEARIVSGPVRFGPLPIQRLAIEELPSDIPGWLPLGDALLVTPPSQGRGVALLVEQVELVAEALGDRCPPGEIRSRLADLATRRWTEAALLQGLRLLR